MANKRVPIYFYFLLPQVAILREGETLPSMEQTIDYTERMLFYVEGLPLIDKKRESTADEKVTWLHSVDIRREMSSNSASTLLNWSADIVVKSAKYNQVRTVIDTTTMQEKGRVKGKNDGDEELTHFCIRYHRERNELICIQESNYYGIRISKFVWYLNQMYEAFRNSIQGVFAYSLSSEIMPSDTFLNELDKMNRINLLTLEVTRQSIPDSFMRYANRGETKDTVGLVLKKKKRNIPIPKEIVRNYYSDMQGNENIVRIRAEGINSAGPFILDTEAMKMKQSLTVSLTEDTDEVVSTSFFAQAEILLKEMK